MKRTFRLPNVNMRTRIQDVIPVLEETLDNVALMAGIQYEDARAFVQRLRDEAGTETGVLDNFPYYFVPFADLTLPVYNQANEYYVCIGHIVYLLKVAYKIIMNSKGGFITHPQEVEHLWNVQYLVANYYHNEGHIVLGLRFNIETLTQLGYCITEETVGALEKLYKQGLKQIPLNW